MKSVRVRAARGLASGVALMAVLGLAGCGRAEPGVVAYVGNDKITQTQLDAAVSGISGTLEAGQTVSTEAVVNAMIHGEISDQLAAAEHLTITDADRDAVLTGSNLAPLLNVPAAKAVAYDVADQQIVAKKVGSQAYLAAAAKTKVTLNPRYGVLDPAQKTIVSDQSGGLAKPGATATP